jgi:hypothetical protein
MQAKIMAALDAAWALAERSSDPAVIALAREKARACGQMAATARKVAAMVPIPKAAKPAKAENPLELIQDFVGRLDRVAPLAETPVLAEAKPPEAKPPEAKAQAAQAVAMRAALRKLGRR